MTHEKLDFWIPYSTNLLILVYHVRRCNYFRSGSCSSPNKGNAWLLHKIKTCCQVPYARNFLKPPAPLTCAIVTMVFYLSFLLWEFSTIYHAVCDFKAWWWNLLVGRHHAQGLSSWRHKGIFLFSYFSGKSCYHSIFRTELNSSEWVCFC